MVFHVLFWKVLVTNPDMTPAVRIPVECGKELGVTSEEGLAHITVNTQGRDKKLEITVSFHICICLILCMY